MTSNKFFLYGHNGSGNHGCEAIVRSTAKILRNSYSDNEVILASNGCDEDNKYGLNKVVTIKREKNQIKKLSFSFIDAYFNLKVLKKDLKIEELTYRDTFLNNDENTIALSIGGDNYCYPGYERFTMLHNMLIRKKAKTVLWGCSVEPTKINDDMAMDLKNCQSLIYIIYLV